MHCEYELKIRYIAFCVSNQRLKWWQYLCLFGIQMWLYMLILLFSREETKRFLLHFSSKYHGHSQVHLLIDCSHQYSCPIPYWLLLTLVQEISWLNHDVNTVFIPLKAKMLTCWRLKNNKYFWECRRNSSVDL